MTDPRHDSTRTPFEVWLDEYWPMWREPKNTGSVRWHDLRAAVEAGQKVKRAKPKSAKPDCPNWPRCQCVTRGYVNHRENNDCGRKPKTPQRPRNHMHGDIVDAMFGD
jgi:hypothetical protein